MENTREKLKSSFKLTLPVLAPTIIGVILFIVYYFYKGFDWLDLCRTVAEFIIIGGILSAITNSDLFMKIFRDELLDIIYEGKYLENVKDLKSIWRRTSNILFNSKFPKITDPLLEVIHEHYLPIKEIMYNENYEYVINITWIDKKKNHIKVSQSLSSTLITDTKNKFEFITESAMIPDHKNSDNNIEDACYVVNGVEVNVREKNNYYDEVFGFLKKDFVIDLEGSDKYAITKKFNTTTDIDIDPYIGFHARNLTYNLRLKVHKPKDIYITFVQRGTIKKYIPIENLDSYIEFKYEGLILPEQGFILIMKKI